MESKESNPVDEKIQLLVRLTAANLVKEKSISEASEILNRMGMKPKEIAVVLGTTSNVISVRLHERKRKNMRR